jgi:uncharacterized protein YjbJ (UPF0337 family)
MGDKERIEGADDKFEGEVKEDVGKAFGDRKLEIEGKGDKIKGDIREGIGDVEGKVDDLIHRKKDD